MPARSTAFPPSLPRGSNLPSSASSGGVTRGSHICLVAITALAMASLAGCRRKHVPVAKLEEKPYPSCPGSPALKLIGESKLVSGPNDARRFQIVETTQVFDGGCNYVIRQRQVWALQYSESEIIYDRSWNPLRIWRRNSLDNEKKNVHLTETVRIDLRTKAVTILGKDAKGKVRKEHLHGGVPKAVLGTGRGTISGWIKAAKLKEGTKVRQLVLDMRGIELIRPITLIRRIDRYEKTLGRKVRVYTIYGRESVFTDENDVVIGDLQGLVPWSKAKTKIPPLRPFPKTAPRTTPKAR